MLRLFLACLFLSLPAQLLAAWQSAETAHFRIHADLPTEDLAARAEVLEGFHALLVRATGRSLPDGAPPLDVFLVKSLEDASPWRGISAGIAGFYRADSGRISAFALAGGSGKPGGLTSQQLLLHEYAHHFLLGSGRFAYPAWYVEGFAEYFSTATFAEGRVTYGLPAETRAIALAQGQWLPLDRLLARDPRLARGSSAAMFYAQSWVLTHYLFRTPGMRDKLAAYLRAQASGEDPVSAFRRIIDPDLAGFQQKLRRHAAAGIGPGEMSVVGSSPTVDVQPLPASAGALLLRKAALEHGAVPTGTGAQSRGTALAEIRSLAAGYPDDAFAGRTVALAELQLGRPEAAGRLLDAELALAPRDAELLRWRAQAARAARTAEGSAEARRFLVRSYSADPADWRTLHAYARLYRRTADPMPDEVMPILLKAYALAPQVTEIVLDTALALSNAGRLDEAASVLEPLAFAPHGGPASELAQRMLQRARAGDQAGLLAQVQALQKKQLVMQSSRIAAAHGR
ncbi:MAG: DUF1570 domain-containing protein [Sandaracinobacteroides sp.]